MRPLLKISLAAGMAASAAFALAAPKDYVSGEVLVKFKPVARDAGKKVAVSDGYKVESGVPVLGIDKLRLPKGMSVELAMKELRTLPWVEFVEPNYIYHATFTPNDTSFGSQWGPKKIQSEQAWDINKGDPTVVIAIIDTGISSTHPDLASKRVAGWNFVSNNNNPNDDNGHGSHCAGIAAAITNNATGVAGVGFNCSLMPVKVLNSGGSGTLQNVANGINWAADNGANVLSLSLGGSGATSMQQAVDYAWSKNCVVVAAAGNNGSTSMFYPAAYTNCIAVAATTTSDTRASFSNYGSNWVDVAAPGVNIYSTYMGSQYATLDGTSMACPHVSGLAGLLFSAKGKATPNSTVRSLIEQNCDSVGTFVAFGRINAYKSLLAAGGGNTVYANPQGYVMYSGSQVSGNYTNLKSSDNSYLVLASQNNKVDWFGPMYPASGSGTITNVTFTFEGSATVAGTATVQAYNYLAGGWETLGNINLTTSDQTWTFPISTNPHRFRDPFGEMDMRVSYQASSSFQLKNDWMQVAVTRQ